MSDTFPLTLEEFHAIYSKVPRLNVEIVLKSPEGIYLTQRDIEPCKGQWHLPGGTVYYGETLRETVDRVAQRELGITVTSAKHTGYLEYPSHFKNNLGHPFGVVFEVTDYDGQVSFNQEAQDGGWFMRLPEPMHADQDSFLKSHKLVQI